MRLYGVLFLSFILCGSPVFGAGRLAKKGVKDTNLLQARKIKKLEEIKKVEKKGAKNKKEGEVKGKVAEKKREVRERAGVARFVRGRRGESTVLSRADSECQQTEQRVRAREAAAKEERFPHQMVRVEREAKEKAKALAKVEAAKVAEARRRARLEQKKARALVLRAQLQEKPFDAPLEKYQEKLRNLTRNLSNKDKILKLSVDQNVDQSIAPGTVTIIDTLDSTGTDNMAQDSADNAGLDSASEDTVTVDSLNNVCVSSVGIDTRIAAGDFSCAKQFSCLENQRSQFSPFSSYSQDKFPEFYKCEKPSCLKNGKHTCLSVMVESAHCWPELPENDQKENPALMMIAFDKEEAVLCESESFEAQVVSPLLLKSCTGEIEHEQSAAPLFQVSPVSRVLPVSKRKNPSFQGLVPVGRYGSFARFQGDGVLEAPRPSLFRAISTAHLYKAHLYKTWRNRKDMEALAKAVAGKSDELTCPDAYAAEARLRALRCAQGVGFSNYAGIFAALESPLQYNRQLARSFLVHYTYNPVSILLTE